MNALEIAALVVGVVVGAGGLIATIWAVGKVKGVETSIDLLGAANEGLRSANEDLRVELAHSERTCAERLARLEGQNAALLDGLGDKLAHAIADRLEPILAELSASIVNGMQSRPAEARTRSTDQPDEVDDARDSKP